MIFSVSRYNLFRHHLDFFDINTAIQLSKGAPANPVWACQSCGTWRRIFAATTWAPLGIGIGDWNPIQTVQ
jgi:hypothetical protein